MTTDLKTFVKDIHFELLGVTRASTKEEIRKAYLEQIKIWHPDKFPNRPDKLEEALERSKKLNEAFALLENYDPPRPFNKNAPHTSAPKSSTSFYNQSRSTKPKAARVNIVRTRVKSSNIHSIGYDRKTNTLQVQFTNGSLYQYYDVPELVYYELMDADSKGKYLNRNIAYKYRYD